MREGVGTRKFGNVVAMVADSDEKKEETDAGDSTGSVELRSAYSPTMGVSLALIPKLKMLYTVRRKDDPICQSIPSALGGVARGHDKQRPGVPTAGPIK